MTHIIRKMFWDYEKEEEWLNAMAAKGMMLTDYTWCRYVFEEGTPKEYTFRIELLEHASTHPESKAYIHFMKENGIDCVASYKRWVYFRRNSSEGAFDIYTDLESKLQHYKRIHLLWMTLMAVELIVGLLNILISVVNLNFNKTMGNYSIVNLIVGSLLFALALLFWRLDIPIRRKIKKLQREQQIRE
ncbi:DUF2812 domain-containing protein [Paenibacillus pini]|uniref:DUF2812 domain-containing protein n=1 Tax=Paenibacillus pini JCM 16418 TaxID=1236976 RepID=W7YWZ2_9BACL|nr:DUF2812 domain-containing protein [Paenibacillus pini]GAF09201.1 hypothetical protein JCM16418_3321 [Paenibacillus pini JCM 16418]